MQQVEGQESMSALLKVPPTDESVTADDPTPWVGKQIRDGQMIRRLHAFAAENFEAAWSDVREEDVVGNVLDLNFRGNSQSSQNNRKSKIRIFTLSNDQTVFLTLTNRLNAGANAPYNHKMLMVDGRPLPKWVKKQGPNICIENQAADSPVLDLQLIVTRLDQIFKRYWVGLDLNTGEITAGEENAATNATIFSDQIELAANGQVHALREMGKQLRDTIQSKHSQSARWSATPQRKN